MFNDALQLLIDCFKNDTVAYSPAINQKNLLTLIRKHRMAHTVRQKIFQALPENSQQKITYLSHKKFQRNLQQKAAMCTVQQHFDSLALPVLFFKGMVMQQWLYQKNDFRPAKDVDILLAASDISQAIDALKTLGYHPFSYKSALPDKPQDLEKLGSLDLKHSETKVIIELHWQLWNKSGEIPTDFTSLWQNRSSFMIDQQSLYTLEPYTHLAYLCYHGSGHFWYRLFWLRDIQLALSNTDIDWGKALDTAKKLGVLPAMILAHYLCQQLFDSKIPSCISRQFSPKIQKMAQCVYNLLEQNLSEQELVPQTPKQIFSRLKWKWQIKSKHRLRSLIKLI